MKNNMARLKDNLSTNAVRTNLRNDCWSKIVDNKAYTFTKSKKWCLSCNLISSRWNSSSIVSTNWSDASVPDIPSSKNILPYSLTVIL